jgi:hypothetical protein
MVEMVHDRIAAGETTVVSTAAVLRCRKQMEKLPHYNFSWDSLSPKTEKLSLEEAVDLSRDRLILEINIWSLAPDGARHQDGLTVGRNVTLSSFKTACFLYIAPVGRTRE